LGPTNAALIKSVQARIDTLKAADPDSPLAIPVDLVTASGSGLDPHISPAAAEYQVHRVAQVRGLDEAFVRQLVIQHTEGRQFGVLGESRVNMLKLNLALDALQKEPRAHDPS
jgi:K+-transporting ATPase ATPase C chain